MARPKAIIDAAQVEAMAQISCTAHEIAEVLGVSERTILRRFAPDLAKGRSTAKMSLRRAQWKKALEGNVVMMIWLGKNVLGQSDSGGVPGGGATEVPTQESLFAAFNREMAVMNGTIMSPLQFGGQPRIAEIIPQAMLHANGNGSSNGNGNGNGNGTPH